jgi:hypothetical protein
MYRKHEEYISTANEGQVILIEHNLNTQTPAVSLYEPVNLSDLKLVSLYDSRIGSIESRGPNVTALTFSSSFEGYVQLIDIQNTRNLITDRIARLEDLSEILVQQQKQLTTSSQWRQMNNYLESQQVALNNKITEIDAEIKKLKSDIDSL